MSNGDAAYLDTVEVYVEGQDYALTLDELVDLSIAEPDTPHVVTGYGWLPINRDKRTMPMPIAVVQDED